MENVPPLLQEFIKLVVMDLNAKYVQSETKFMHKLSIV
jgi:hypothetical protein